MNYFQKGKWGDAGVPITLQGSSVNGADVDRNVDADSDTLTHYDIDDNPEVLNSIMTNMMSKITK